MNTLRYLVLVFAAVCTGSLSSPCHAEISKGEFQKLMTQLTPSKDEPWRTIPWKISLLDAQRTAAKVKKPIFIWAMDGHPLGCT